MNRYQRYFFYVFLILVFFGLGNLWSASFGVSLSKYNDASYIFKKQLLWVVVSLVSIWFIYRRLDRDILYKYAGLFGFIALVLTSLVFLPTLGKSIKGATRWLNFGIFTLQPTEFLKIGIVLFIARNLVKHSSENQLPIKAWAYSTIFIAISFLIVVNEPDFGYAIIIIVIGGIMLFIGRMPISFFLLGGIFALPIFYFFVYKVPYRWKRVIAFLNPELDPTGKGYQMLKSISAITSGGFFGKGIGASTFKYKLLPEPYTDFIFSIIVEEIGIMGATFLIALYILLGLFALKIAKRLQDDFSRYVIIGFISLLWLQAFFNIGVSIGLLPTTGLPLPFISYGGSSYLSFSIMIGIILSLGKKTD